MAGIRYRHAVSARQRPICRDRPEDRQHPRCAHVTDRANSGRRARDQARRPGARRYRVGSGRAALAAPARGRRGRCPHGNAAAGVYLEQPRRTDRDARPAVGGRYARADHLLGPRRAPRLVRRADELGRHRSDARRAARSVPPVARRRARPHRGAGAQELAVVQKQTANQIRRIEELQQYVRTVDHVKKMVAELESSRAANPKIIHNICANIARELSHMRQRALTADLGTLPDVAGSLAIVANRAGTGIMMKVRALADGVNSMTMQLDQALKMAHEMPPEKGTEKKQS